MTQLYLLQFTSCVVTALMAVMLAVSRFQIRWPSERYETSRWLIAFGMAMLSLHYVLQMKHGFRERGDEIGAVVNILFYAPIALIISYATYNVVCSHPKGRKRYIQMGILFYLLILAVFAVGYQVMGSLRLGFFVIVMLGLFFASIVYCFMVNVMEMRRHRKIMEEESATDMLPYDRFTFFTYLHMGVSVTMLMGGILYRPLLFFVGPLMLLSLFTFTTSFVAYGYNIMPADDLLDEETDESVSGVDTDKMARIEAALRDWCVQGGYRDSTTNMISLSLKIQVSKDDLSQYFERYLGSTFRVWLSDIRFQEAQRLIKENPELSNDSISMECGLSSHAHLYKIFKAKTGMTPRQWKLSQHETAG